MTSAERPSLADVFARSERMVGRRIAEEYVLVPIVGRGADLDAIFNLNRVGAFIWERLDGSSSGEEIVRALVEEFDVDSVRAVEDYRAFMAQLLSIDAVRPCQP
ncbi:MAG TPA: PqqD family protein [Vicinamibacteria bacterium]|nr:PqqD family protein [Vicinamibacteria bacterium]